MKRQYLILMVFLALPLPLLAQVRKAPPGPAGRNMTARVIRVSREGTSLRVVIDKGEMDGVGPRDPGLFLPMARPAVVREVGKRDSVVVLSEARAEDLKNATFALYYRVEEKKLGGWQCRIHEDSSIRGEGSLPELKSPDYVQYHCQRCGASLHWGAGTYKYQYPLYFLDMLEEHGLACKRHAWEPTYCHYEGRLMNNWSRSAVLVRNLVTEVKTQWVLEYLGKKHAKALSGALQALITVSGEARAMGASLEKLIEIMEKSENPEGDPEFMKIIDSMAGEKEEEGEEKGRKKEEDRDDDRDDEGF